MSDAGAHVAKLGGSLIDPAGLPDLLPRFERWRRCAMGPRGVVVVGGGEAADIVRAFDKAYGLDESRAHWGAVRAMSLNAELIAAVVAEAALVSDAAGCEEAWARGRLAIVEPLSWLERAAARGVTIPHRWSFTSDSIAAHVAVQLAKELGSARLTLLKSTLPDRPCDIQKAAALGVVDADFPQACASLERVDLVNLRSADFERCALRGA